MSTLGKVLVILVVLSLLGWIFLAALVADHHINWSKRFKDVEKQVAELKASLPPLRAEMYELADEASTIQVGLDKLRRNFRAELAMEQKEESETKESLARYEYQAKTAQLEAAAAEKRHEVRRQEKLDFDKKIAQEKVLVQEQIAENTKLKEELKTLRDTFLATVAENKSFMERLKSAVPAANRAPRTRLGSMVR